MLADKRGSRITSIDGIAEMHSPPHSNKSTAIEAGDAGRRLRPGSRCSMHVAIAEVASALTSRVLGPICGVCLDHTSH
jgi:hypothetical protein